MKRQSLIVFWAALVLAFAMAIMPSGAAEELVWDKAQHAFAFGALAILGAYAYRKVPLPLIALLLIVFGILIECAQAIPAIHRDSSVLDVIADAVGIFGGFIIVSILRNASAVSDYLGRTVRRPDFWIFVAVALGPVAFILVGQWLYFRFD